MQGYTACILCCLQDKFDRLVKQYTEWSEEHGAGRLHYVVWDLTPVTYADSSGLRFFDNMVLWAQSENVGLLLANPSRRLVQDW